MRTFDEILELHFGSDFYQLSGENTNYILAAMEECRNQDVRDKIYILNQLELIGDELFRKFGTESYELRCMVHDLKPKI